MATRFAEMAGLARCLSGEQAAAALTLMSDRVFPGRSSEVPRHTGKHLAATQALSMDIVDGGWTVKIREGAPGEPGRNDAVADDLWTGVFPLRTVHGRPQAAPHQSPDVPVSASVLASIAANQ